MNLNNRVKFCILLNVLFWVLFVGACGKPESTSLTEESSAAPVHGMRLPEMSGDNVMPVTVNGELCAKNSYPNKPCVAVTVCEPGTNSCQTISDILLDTGSTGLRLFRSLVPQLSLPSVSVGAEGYELAECVQFGDGASDWGPVVKADLRLGNEQPVTVPIQLIDANFNATASTPIYCSGADRTPVGTGFNGILGLGLFSQDCGEFCVEHANNQLYFACTGQGCMPVAVAEAQQVQNPVVKLPQNNNGILLRLPNLPLGGASFANGYVILGIGTQDNNTPSSNITPYPADPRVGRFKTTFNNITYSSFIDSGSNSINFPAPNSIPDCGAINPRYTGFLCPIAGMSFSASTIGVSGSPTAQIPFQIGNWMVLAGTANNAFMELGGRGSTELHGVFDWGLPFFFGRDVYIGVADIPTPLGTGPFWAF